MKIAVFIFLSFFIHKTAFAQYSNDMNYEFLDDDFQFNYGPSSVGGGSSISGFGIGWHSLSFDSDLHFSYENYMMNELTYALISGDFEYLNWGTPNITHGLLGDASMRWTVFRPIDAAVFSAGVASSNYYISGLNDLNGNYLTAGVSLGLNFGITENMAIFTRAHFSKAYYGKGPNRADKTIDPWITDFQAILKWDMFSVDYGVIMVDGKSRNILRAGIWLDLL